MTFLCSFCTYRHHHHHHHQSIQHNLHICPILAHRLRRIPKMLPILMSTRELAHRPTNRGSIQLPPSRNNRQSKPDSYTPPSASHPTKTKTYHNNQTF